MTPYMTTTFNTTDWEEAIQRCAAKPCRVMVMGQVDSGKSTLTKLLVQRILEHQPQVAVLDLDLGQSEVGPPTTMGLGVLDHIGQQLGFAKPLALGFVGALTPGGLGMETMTALLPMLPVIPSDMSCVIDGHGLVKGGVARRLWISYYEALKPDYILAIQVDREIEPILQSLERRPVKIIRLPRPQEAMAKNHQTRVEHRQKRLLRHLASMQRVRCAWDDLPVEGSWLFSGEAFTNAQIAELSSTLGQIVVWAERIDERIYAVIRSNDVVHDVGRLSGSWGNCSVKQTRLCCFEQLVCGLINGQGICRSLAICEKINFNERYIQLMSPYTDMQDIAAIRLGRLFVSSTGMIESNAPLGEYY